MCNFVSSFEEVLHWLLVCWILTQVLFGDAKCFELLNGVVIMSNLWESKAPLVDLWSMHMEWSLRKSKCLDLLSDFESILIMFLV